MKNDDEAILALEHALRVEDGAQANLLYGRLEPLIRPRLGHEERLLGDSRQGPVYYRDPVELALKWMCPQWCDQAIGALQRLRGMLEGESTRPTASRQKGEKFGILDAPGLLTDDLQTEPGRLGTACVYMDIDDFKCFNTDFSERIVDRDLLPEFQRLVAATVQSHGFAYAEGGDEVTILLPNATQAMAVALIEGLRILLRKREFAIAGGSVELRISAGVSHAGPDADRTSLPERANEAMRQAKAGGKDRICTSEEGERERDGEASKTPTEDRNQR